jgi:hypothetical protein
MRRAMRSREASGMHSEYLDGLVLRPLMDAGYTAWRDGRRVGVARFVDGEIRVEAADLRTSTALVDRLAADLRAAGIMREGSSQAPPAARPSGSSQQDAKSAA